MISISRFLAWLNERPTEKPHDLLEFEKAQARVKEAAKSLTHRVDEWDKQETRQKRRKVRQ